MAVPEKVIDRALDNILLPKEISSEIWQKTIEESAVMQLAQRETLPGVGIQYQTITKDPEAEWVDEGEEKPVSDVGVGTTSWQGYKLASILLFTNEFRRDASRLYSEIVARAPRVFGSKIDATVFGDGQTPKKPGELFDTMADVQEVDISEGDLWDNLVAADALISANDGILDGWAISPALKSVLLTEKDLNQRPLFVNSMNTDNNVPNVMGHPTYVKKAVHLAGTAEKGEQLGFAGDWSSARYGVVEDISMRISDTATVNADGTQINLWQRNMFAVLFEMTVGFKMRYKEHFVKLVGAKSEAA